MGICEPGIWTLNMTHSGSTLETDLERSDDSELWYDGDKQGAGEGWW